MAMTASFHVTLRDQYHSGGDGMFKKTLPAAN
jgi:hypothetical protein